jgi:hypothetical protein
MKWETCRFIWDEMKLSAVINSTWFSREVKNVWKWDKRSEFMRRRPVRRQMKTVFHPPQKLLLEAFHCRDVYEFKFAFDGVVTKSFRLVAPTNGWQRWPSVALFDGSAASFIEATPGGRFTLRPFCRRKLWDNLQLEFLETYSENCDVRIQWIVWVEVRVDENLFRFLRHSPSS